MRSRQRDKQREKFGDRFAELLMTWNLLVEGVEGDGEAGGGWKKKKRRLDSRHMAARMPASCHLLLLFTLFL